jgi:outer membrane lipoprotein-sorting protein
MIRAGSSAVALAALAIAVFAGAGAAQTNPPVKEKMKAKAKAESGPSVAVTVTNKRKSGVIELDVALAGSPAFRPILRNLGPGKQAVVNLSKDENCRFDFYIKYDDGATSTVPGVNVCDDGKLNLVE